MISRGTDLRNLLAYFATICLVTQSLTIGSLGGQAQAIDWPWSKPSQSNERNLEQQQQQLELEFSQQSNIFKNAQLTSKLADTLRYNNEGQPIYACVEPSLQLFENFLQQYSRKIPDPFDKLSRAQEFHNTVKRTILLNKIVGSSILNVSQFSSKPEMGNYYLITPNIGDNWALWYADINDCELGLMKDIMFKIMYLIDDNYLSGAYEKALNASSHLPFLSPQGFQQMAEILIIRLFDRFEGDSSMDKLFKWPMYAKKLASYAYNRLEASQPNFKSKLALISFAYPSFFKDIKYNTPAVNRSQDNIVMHEDHEEFNRWRKRRFMNTKERNKRLVIFRQRITHVRLLSDLNDQSSGQSGQSNQIDWLFKYPGSDNGPQMARFRRLNEIRLPKSLAGGYVPPRQGYNNEPSAHSGRLLALENPRLSPIPLARGQQEQWRSQFSDLSDEEFVAYLTQDTSALDKDQIRFLEDNFHVEPLSQEFRDEIAFELLFRRTIQEHMNADATGSGQQRAQQENQPLSQEMLAAKLGPYSLARQVVDELISDIGLPMGPVTLTNHSDADARDMFTRVAKISGKIYALPAGSVRQNQPNYLPEPNENELADERARRLETFKVNYGRFRAWWTKDQWPIEHADRQSALLRLADMEWAEMKLILFKLCCLLPSELQTLSRYNITLHYLASQSFMCQPIAHVEPEAPSAAQQLQSFRPAAERLTAESGTKPDEMLAKELYYYYNVHFNKHHTASSFDEGFAIFRSNIESIKRHSCQRSFTLFKALSSKRDDLMNTIDVMDPRRSYMDDINLDRFKYFSIPSAQIRTSGGESRSYQATSRGGRPFNQGSDSEAYETVGFERLRASQQTSATSNGDQQDQFTGGRKQAYSYPNFYGFANREQSDWQNSVQAAMLKPSYLDQVLAENQNRLAFVRNYQAHKVARVYDLVADRYKLCHQMILGSEPYEGDVAKRRCQASGPLADHSVHPRVDQQQISRLTMQGGQQQIRAQQGNEPSQHYCEYYWTGLQSWSKNLVQQDDLVIKEITAARC